MFKKNRSLQIIGILVVTLFLPTTCQAMHIAEGFLPLEWALVWWLIALGGLIPGMKRLKKVWVERPEQKMMVAMVTAFIFILSALKLPSLTGSSSHATGVGLGAILFGPVVMIPMGFVVLLFQALLLAHGGITTLGANGVAMAIVGPLVTYGMYKGVNKLNLPQWLGIFTGVVLGDLATYLVTAGQLALGHPAAVGGVMASWVKFMGVFGVTQIPLALVEGMVTLLVIRILMQQGEVSSLTPQSLGQEGGTR